MDTLTTLQLERMTVRFSFGIPTLARRFALSEAIPHEYHPWPGIKIGSQRVDAIHLFCSTMFALPITSSRPIPAILKRSAGCVGMTMVPPWPAVAMKITCVYGTQPCRKGVPIAVVATVCKIAPPRSVPAYCLLSIRLPSRPLPGAPSTEVSWPVVEAPPIVLSSSGIRTQAPC